MLNFGQIYETLKQLKRRGLVSARFDGGDGHLGRWLYTITPKGRSAVATWLKKRPAPPGLIRNEIFIRLLARGGDPNSALAQIAQQQRVYREYLAELRSLAVADAYPLQSLVRDAEVFRTEAHLLWLDHAATIIARWQAARARPTEVAAVESIPGEPRARIQSGGGS
jgi:DNA-binding PadR family transcriptional regulator